MYRSNKACFLLKKKFENIKHTQAKRSKIYSVFNENLENAEFSIIHVWNKTKSHATFDRFFF